MHASSLGSTSSNNCPLTHTASLDPTDPLIDYLNKAADGDSGFRALLNSVSQSLANDQNPPLNLDFRVKLVQVLMQTSWYAGGWETYLCTGGPITFATNFTNADAQEYYDDNVAPFDDNVFAPNAWGKVKKTK